MILQHYGKEWLEGNIAIFFCGLNLTINVNNEYEDYLTDFIDQVCMWEADIIKPSWAEGMEDKQCMFCRGFLTDLKRIGAIG